MAERPLCLSIMQPWAWLITNGFKTVENRTWATKIRGPVRLHAGKRLDRAAAADVWSNRHPVTGKPFEFDAPAQFELGGIVGEADLVDCVERHPSDFFVGPHGFVFQSARPVAFIPCRGALGFFRLPEVSDG